MVRMRLKHQTDRLTWWQRMLWLLVLFVGLVLFGYMLRINFEQLGRLSTPFPITITLRVPSDFEGCIRVYHDGSVDKVIQSVTLIVPHDGRVLTNANWVSQPHSVRIERDHGATVRLLYGARDSTRLRSDEASINDECHDPLAHWSAMVKR